MCAIAPAGPCLGRRALPGGLKSTNDDRRPTNGVFFGTGVSPAAGHEACPPKGAAAPGRDLGVRSGVSIPRAQIALIGKLPVRRQLVDDARKVPGELRKQIVMPGTRLAGKIVDGLLPERLAQLVGRDRLVLAGADPGVDHVLQAVLLELIDEHVETP